MSECNQSKQLLTNVAIIRPILIVLLVFYHAFAIYSGAWEPISGFPEVRAYWWLDKLSFAFMLEMFVFVSGYVFGFQVRNKGEEKLAAKNLFWGKFKRLIIPSMVFSLLYIIIFTDITHPLTIILYEVVGGFAHMWFLPMLFWCFTAVWIIEKLRLKPQFVFPILVLSSLFSFVPLPLQLTSTLYYLLFFYIGYIIQRNNLNIAPFYSQKLVVIMVIAFLLLFPLLTLFIVHIQEAVKNNNELFYNTQITVILSAVLINLSKLIYSLVGLTALFLIIGYCEKNRTSSFPQWIINVGAHCMGVYIFQQFLLKGLYNYTELPTLLGPFLLPWVGFLITLLLSLLLSYMMRLTKVGRFLIG